jgi:O-antigen/teichoic acid export membrane protein
MGALKDFSKDTLVYGLGAGVKKFIGLFLLPFYTKALSPAEYGVLDTLGTLIFFITTFFNFGLDTAAGYYYFIATDEKEKGKILYTTLILRLVIIIPILFISLTASSVSQLLFKSGSYTHVLWITFLLVPVTLIMSEQEFIYRAFRSPWKYNILTILKSLLSVAGGIYLVITLKKGVYGAQLASFLSSFLVICFSFFWYTRKKYTYHFDLKWAKRLLKYGAPLILAGLASWIYIGSDRFFLLYYKDLTQIGYYSIGNTFAQPIGLINMAVQMSFGVIIMTIYGNEMDENKPETKRACMNILNLYLIVSISISILISVYSIYIVNALTSTKYTMGALSIPFLLFSNISSQCLQLIAIGIIISKKTWHYTWLIIVSALLNFGVNFYFIPKYGFVGAAFTTFLANFVYLVMAYFVSRYYFKINYNSIKIVAYFILGLLICLVVPFSELSFHYNISILLKFLLCIVGLTLPFIFQLILLSDLKTGIKQVRDSILKLSTEIRKKNQSQNFNS